MYSEGMDDGQKTPHGHPDFNSYVKILRVLVFITDRQTDRQTDRRMDRDINPVWASLTTFLQIKYKFRGRNRYLEGRNDRQMTPRGYPY
jgi:hypothetical protein